MTSATSAITSSSVGRTRSFLAAGTAQQWSLNLQRGDDGSVSGLITVSDSRLFQAGHVDGKFSGRTIYGTITDEQGKHVARFNGVLSDDGFRGKYTNRTGETGEWEWEGALPE